MRAEFTRKTKADAFKRADGYCEGKRPDGSRCRLKLQTGKFRYDHIIPDWMGGEPTLENCQVLGMCCDNIKTPRDQADIAKVKRIRDKHKKTTDHHPLAEVQQGTGHRSEGTMTSPYTHERGGNGHR